ncbi:N(2)-fixation sustaining protein CowN [Vibrio olivae]
MSEPDRYISFCNIDCDNNANLLVSMLEHHLTANHGHAQWHSYFENKRQEQANMQRDNLNFVGNQLNMLYEYFVNVRIKTPWICCIKLSKSAANCVNPPS